LILLELNKNLATLNRIARIYVDALDLAATGAVTFVSIFMA
jgi:hypothetical protein